MKKIMFLIVVVLGWFLAPAQTHWTPVTGYESTMSVTGVIIIDGVEQTSTQLEIGAFCGDECRGAKKAGFFPPTSQYTVPISIAGLSGDLITFRVYDHSQGQELDLESESSLTFEINAVIGTFGNWYQFVFTTSQPASWSNPETWGGSVPDEGSSVTLPNNVIIDNNASVTVAEMTIPTEYTLTIESGSTLIVNGDLICNDETGLVIEDGAQVINASPNVKATVEKDINAFTAKDTDGWYLISSSVNEMAIAGSDFITESYDLYRYKENGNGSVWENYRAGHADFTAFENARGYLYANSNSFTPVFTGDLNYDDIARPITCTGSNAISGFNVIGNPFPHNIYKGAGGAIDDASLAAGYYTLSFKGEWEAHTYEEAILPEQGIMVKTTTSKDLIIVKTTDAATSETTAKNEIARLKFMVSGEKGEDRAYVYFGEGIGLDKIDHLSDVAPMIYIANDGGDYAITMIDEETERFNLNFKAKNIGWYTLNVNADGDFSYLYLFDRLTGEEVDLLLENSYTFIGAPGDSENRFFVKVKDFTDVDENYANMTFAYVSNGEIIVNGNGTLQMFDITGKNVMNVNVNGVETVRKPSPGLYIVRIVNETNVKTQKIVVR
ncbi:MAG: T9SS type A sorting domain-containing protein [Bacteroidales bacterium]|nr:T9SS type A sorting domain-containing protein [Bacteroidales bacterium]